MQYRTYVYSDPTGGGNDAVLVLPEIVREPDELILFDQAGGALRFEMDEENSGDLVEDGDSFNLP